MTRFFLLSAGPFVYLNFRLKENNVCPGASV